MSQHHQVENIKIEAGMLSLLVDGKFIEHSLETLSPLLAQATSQEQSVFEISPSGYGIHWPLIDEDISVDGLLGIVHQPLQHKKSA